MIRFSRFLLWLLLVPSMVHGAHETAEPPLSMEQIEVERQRLDQTKFSDEDKRKQAVALIEEARVALQEGEKWEREKARLEALLKQKKPSLTRPLSHLKVKELKFWKKERLEQELALRKSRLQEVREEFSGQEKALASLMAAAKTGGGEIADTRKELDDAKNALADIKTQEPLLHHLQQLRLKARIWMLEKRLNYLTLRQNNIVPLVEYAQKRRDLLEDELDRLNGDIEQLQKLLQLKQVSKAEETAQTIVTPVFSVPALKPLSEEAASLALEHEKVLAEAIEADRRLSNAKRRLDDLKNDFNHLRHIVAVVGNDEAVANLLLKRFALLPSLREVETMIAEVNQQLNQAEIRQLAVEEWLRDNRDFETWSRRFLERAKAENKDTLRHLLQQLWDELRATRQSLLQTYTSDISKLSELAATLGRLKDVIVDYRGFLQRQLIWMPTSSPVSLLTPKQVLEGIQWLADPHLYHSLRLDGLRLLYQHPGRVALWLLVLTGMWGMRRRCRRWLAEAAEARRRIRTDSFLATVWALLATLILASPLAWLLAGMGWLLINQKGGHEDVVVIGKGLLAAGQAEWILDGLIQLTRKEGLARLHFGWSDALCRLLRIQAGWFRPLAIPLLFLLQLSAEKIEVAGLLALGRLAFNVLMLILALVIYRIWRRRSPLMQSLANRPQLPGWVRFHGYWFLLLMGVPLGLMVATLLGYYYMAMLLTSYLFKTFVFVFAVLLLRDLLMRWLQVVQRRLRFEEIVRRHQEAAAAEGKTAEELPPLPEGDELDYIQLSGQVRQLLQTGFLFTLIFGLWFIWRDLVPAFNIFSEIQLPLTTVKMEEGVMREVPLTLADVMTGLLLGLLTLLAARKLPALLELTLLHYLPLSRPSCYAVTTLTQYLVATVGIILTFKALGLRWSSIQWLVAALSVGLGFGLQEVVANFVSGVILLFEQPIRVGDVVTVDGVTGTVAKIRIRATTIVNWERQELVIPNKNFITGQLINWTLSDTVTRIIVTVGIAYGSDVEKAMALMKAIAEENPKVLEEPAPLVTFEEFGDNALTLMLRAYLDDVDVRLSTATELHKAINQKFEQAGIVIAFPQRDVHLDTARPLEIVLRQDPVAR